MVSPSGTIIAMWSTKILAAISTVILLEIVVLVAISVRDQTASRTVKTVEAVSGPQTLHHPDVLHYRYIDSPMPQSLPAALADARAEKAHLPISATQK